MREIALSNGGITLVDDEDYELLKKYTWRTVQGYVTTLSINLSLSRLITKCPSGLEVDHKDHNPLNNQKSNLRICTKSQNRAYRYKTKKNTTSTYKGVYWNKLANRWMAYIRLNSKAKYIGYYNCEVEAAKAYNEMAEIHYGEYAILNEV
jgi:hypothetical protein